MWFERVWTGLMGAAQDCPISAAAVLFLAVGVGAVATVVVRERRFSPRSVGSLLAGLAWASPAVAVLALVAVRVIPQLQTTAPAAEADGPELPSDEDSHWTLKPAAEWPALSERELAEWDPDVVMVNVPSVYTGFPSDDESATAAGYRVVLESEQHSRIDAAREELAERATTLVAEDFTRNEPKAAGWKPSAKAVRDKAVVAEHVAKIEHELPGSGRKFKMHQVRWVVELSPKVRQSFESEWRPEVGASRLALVAGLGALLTAVFATLAAYFRFDMKTAGRYRRRLKVAAVSAVVAFGLGFLQLAQTIHG